MTLNNITFIASVTSKLEIGKDGGLMYESPSDLAFFKTVTNGHTIIMGRKTWDSIPKRFRPLKNRENIVLSKTKGSKKKSIESCGAKVMTFSSFKTWYRQTIQKTPNRHYFVIGGASIYKMFLDDSLVTPSKMILTHIVPQRLQNENQPQSKRVSFSIKSKMSYFPSIPDTYQLISYSEQHDEILSNNKSISYRVLMFRRVLKKSCERNYLHLLNDILDNGVERLDRTGTGTISVFGRQMRFDLSNGKIPVLTTKHVPWKSCIQELLWFLRGDTDARVLQKQGVKIWDGNTSREFLDSRGLTHYDEGILGPGYGFQWRHFGALYKQEYADTSTLTNPAAIGGFDQIEYILHELKTNPYSRRIFLSAWNPAKNEEMALVPCHVSCQFYVDNNERGEKRLSCHMYQRSADMFLGEPWNILSYSILTCLLAKKCNITPHELIISLGDAHIYKDHIKNVEIQLQRDCRPFPQLVLVDDIISKDFKDISIDDFSIIGYFPHEKLGGKMSI